MLQRLLVFVCLFANYLYSQQSGSPYSYYGVGKTRLGGVTVSSALMQRLSTHVDSLEVNLLNPASYGDIKKVNLTAGANYSSVNITNPDYKGSYNQFSVGYFSLGIPISQKASFGFGLAPYSTVRYNIISRIDPKSDTRKINTGRGGINRTHLSIGYAITKNINLGASIKYNFGRINTSDLISVKNVQLSSLKSEVSRLGGVSYDFALKYKKNIFSNYKIYVTGIYVPESQIESRNGREKSVVSNSSLGLVIFDKEVENLDKKGLSTTTIVLPMRTTIGVGIGKQRKWFVGAEYRFLENSRFSAPFFQREGVRYVDAVTYALGGYYIPKYSSFDQYLKRIVYMAGISFGGLGMVINDKEINRVSTSIGFSFPIRMYGKINLGFEYSREGLSSGYLVKEDIFSIKVGFSFNNIWFINRKYN